jgi:hypothetical protein
MPSILSTLRFPRLPTFPGLSIHRYSSSYSTALAITSASLLAAVALLCAPAAYRDYKKFISYGPGGPPHNVIGWLAISVLAPLRRDMLDTAVYERDIKEMGEERTWLKDLPERKGLRPEVGTHAAPQRQLDQVPDEDIKEVGISVL